MVWKLLLGLGLFGFLACAVFAVISVRGFYAASFQSSAEDVAFGGLLMSVVGIIISFLVIAIATIFVLRNSKKAFNAGS